MKHQFRKLLIKYDWTTLVLSWLFHYMQCGARDKIMEVGCERTVFALCIFCV